MPLFPSTFRTIAAFSLNRDYVVRSFLPNGIFLLCGHGLDFLHQLMCEFNQSIKKMHAPRQPHAFSLQSSVSSLVSFRFVIFSCFLGHVAFFRVFWYHCHFLIYGEYVTKTHEPASASTESTTHKLANNSQTRWPDWLAYHTTDPLSSL